MGILLHRSSQLVGALILGLVLATMGGCRSGRLGESRLESTPTASNRDAAALAPSKLPTVPIVRVASRGSALLAATLSVTIPTSPAQAPSPQMAGTPGIEPSSDPQAEASTQPEPTRDVPNVSPAVAEAAVTIGRIAIPKLSIDAPVVEVSWHLTEVEGQAVGIWETAVNAAGHHRGTALFGAEGNCVISGHARAQDGGVFDRLWELVPGDAIILQDNAGEQHRYRVERSHKLLELGASLDQRQSNAAYMDGTDAALLTLITCWPDWAYTHRYLVLARPA